MSSAAESFIYTSDFATLKNDDNGTTTVTVPGGVSIAGGAVYTISADLTVGSQLGEARVRIKSSKQGSQFYLGFFGANRTGTESGFPAPYTLFALVSRISATQVRCTCMIPNPYSGTLTGAAGNETFTFTVNTFISPVS